MKTNGHVKTTQITAVCLKNEMMEDKLLGANSHDEHIDHYTNLYEKQTPEQPINIEITPDC